MSSWPGGRAGATLFLAPFSLAGGGKYEVTLYGSVRGGGGATTKFGVSVEVVAQRLVAIIAGGDRRVSSSLPLVLDASGSHDPDQSEEPFNYLWSCSPEPCFADPDGLLLQNAARIVIPAPIAPGTRSVWVEVSKDPGPRAATARVAIEVVPEVVSSVGVAFSAPMKAKVNAGERLALVGSVFSADGEVCAPDKARFAWSFDGGDLALAQPAVRTISLDRERVLH